MKGKPLLWSVILTVISMICVSCGEKIFTSNVNCADCYSAEPDSAELVIDLTINDDFGSVPLIIYKGDVENNQVEYIDTAHDTPYRFWVAVGEKYSVKAQYKKGGHTLVAIDGTKIKVLLVTGTCDQDCYVIKNEKVNVEIRKKFLDF